MSRLFLSIPTPQDIENLAASASRRGFKVEEVGRSQEGRPIYAMRVGSGDVRILIVAGQHGSEPAPIVAAMNFVRMVMENEIRIEGMELAVIPCANPDGLSRLGPCLERCGAPSWKCDCAEARLTASLRDMNRDWLELRLPETQAIHSFIHRFDPHIVLDLHEFYARRGSPPRWAHETEGFDAYVTDAPYIGTSPEVQALSMVLASIIRNAIEKATGLVVKILRPGNGIAAIPPIYLGSHVPLEGRAKVLVETWGVGLGTYLIYERILAHLEAIRRTIEFVSKNVDFVKIVERLDRRYDEIVGLEGPRKYVVKGPDAVRAHEHLSRHGIDAKLVEDSVVIEMPQRFSRIARILLDDSYYLVKLFAERSVRTTIDSWLNVSIHRIY